MKQFKLKIGSPIVSNAKPKKVFELTVKYMHGDADAYTRESWQFKDLDSVAEGFDSTHFTLGNVLAFLDAYNAAPWNSRCGVSNSLSLAELLQINEEILEELGECDFFPGDCTNDYQSLAMIDGFELYYWNESGLKCKVEVTEV
jgi:hypothetical protein